MNVRKKILIVEAHSDDSCISIGGFLEKFRNQYEYHFFLIAVSSIKLHHAGLIDRNSRLAEYAHFVSTLDGTWHRGAEVPFNSDSSLDTVPKKEIVSAVETVIHQVQPDILICQGPSFHHDHTLTYESVIAATRPTARYCPPEIYTMENPTYVHSLGPSTDFKPDFYCQLSHELLEKKLQRFKSCFPSQIREDHTNVLSRSGIQSWARYRGIEAGCEYAEALSTYIRII
jgi:LmbE family N-acetylglucosaminyl deacetylase